MNELQQKWSDRVNFELYDVFTPEGVAKEAELGIRFHGFAILDPYGRLFYKTIGHSIPFDELEKQIEASLVVAPP